MDILNLIDVRFLTSISFILVIFGVFYSFITRKQSAALKKVDASLSLHEQMNRQLGLMLTELRRSNRILTELGGISDPIEPADAYATAGSNLQDNVVNSIKLYVGNVDYSTTEEELANHFSEYGQVEFANIPVNRYTGRPRGFGFVTFCSKAEAERAMSLHGTEFKGRQIQVNFAKERDTVQ